MIREFTFGGICGLLLSLQFGCASADTLEKSSYTRPTDPPYPPVTLIVNKTLLRSYNTGPNVDPYRMNLVGNDVIYKKAGMNSLETGITKTVVKAGLQDDEQSAPEAEGRVVGSITPYQHPEFPVILKNLRDSGLFERVDLNNSYADTTLHLYLEREISDSGTTHFWKTMGSAGTLFCVPVGYNFHYLMRVDVEHKEEVVASYIYEEDMKDYVFLLEDPFDDIHEMVGVLLSHFYADLEKDQLFSRTANHDFEPLENEQILRDAKLFSEEQHALPGQGVVRTD